MKIKISALLLLFVLVYSCKSEPKKEIDKVVNGDYNSNIKVNNSENLNISNRF